MTDIPPFETTFAVPLHCEGCITSVSTPLYKLPGINNVQANLASQLITVLGTAAPSAIVSAIQSTGRDAILRGSGASDAAAVCILETHAPVSEPVRGLVRMVQVAPSLTVVDISVRGVARGTYQVTVRQRGDISRGPESVGPLWEGESEAEEGQGSGKGRGRFGTVEVERDGEAAGVFTQVPVEVWELIGRSIVVSQATDGFDRADPDTLVGVVARSAGVWDNDKTVCSCSGKTVWEERREQVGKGMM